jgi:hypothetical protein
MTRWSCPSTISLGTKVTRLLLAGTLLAGTHCASDDSSSSGASIGGAGGTVQGSGGTIPSAGGTAGSLGGVAGTTASRAGAAGASPSGGSPSNSGGSQAAGGSRDDSTGGWSGGGVGGLGGVGGSSGSSSTTGGVTGRGGTAGTAQGGNGSSGSAGVPQSAGGSAGDTNGSGGSGVGGTTTTLPPVVGDEYFVSTTGDDGNPGTKELPFRSIAGAKAAVRANPDRGKLPITVTVESGTYYVGKTIEFAPEDSGTKDGPVTYRGGGTATLSGGVQLESSFTAFQNGIMQTAVPKEVSDSQSFDVLVFNGERQRMARYPNYQAGVVPFGGGSADAVSSSRVGNWTHSPAGGFVHALHDMRWGSEHFVIKGTSGGTLDLGDPLCNARPSGMLDGSQVVENVFDELDVPGEWYFDREAGVLYFYPPEGADLASGVIELAGLERIVEFTGTSTSKVEWLTLDGFRYAHTARTFMKCDETILRSDWNIYRGGAVFVTGTEDINIQNSFFDQTGGAGLFINSYNRRVNVTGNRFVGTGSSAILVMGLSSAVRNPVFGYYGGTVPLDALDKTPGPKTDDYPAECIISNNLIHDIGDPEKQVAGIGIDMAESITVSHNSIYGTPRSGINIGDGCWGGHIIEYNDVFDTVLETGDHGAFNSWGRDRFWDSNVGTIESRVASDENLPFLDVTKPITIRNNRWRCDHGWDVDLDDGSSNYVITNNIFLSGGLKWREGYERRGENNLFAAGAKMSVHVWPKDNGDVFTHNVFGGYDPANPNGWGESLDYNLLTSDAELSKARGFGVDAHSVARDPNYVDPEHGNFQLDPSSPALTLGIENLPVDITYGVTSLSLRAQARTPFFGASDPGSEPSTRDPTPQSWRDATVKNLMGLNEQSATGLGSDIGVLLVAVPANSQAEADGLLTYDVILQLDGQVIASLDDLNRLYDATTAGTELTLGLYRLQQDTTLVITR